MNSRILDSTYDALARVNYCSAYCGPLEDLLEGVAGHPEMQLAHKESCPYHLFQVERRRRVYLSAMDTWRDVYTS